MDPGLREFVARRAGNRCEYCCIPQSHIPFHSFHVEHVIARQHGGADEPANLSLACDRCNAYKGTNLSSVDPETGRVVELFHPRRDAWHDHFMLRGPEIVGLTPTGRATVRLLRMNDDRRLALRAELITYGELPT
jgi:hypothetical protein